MSLSRVTLTRPGLKKRPAGVGLKPMVLARKAPDTPRLISMSKLATELLLWAL